MQTAPLGIAWCMDLCRLFSTFFRFEKNVDCSCKSVHFVTYCFSPLFSEKALYCWAHCSSRSHTSDKFSFLFLLGKNWEKLYNLRKYTNSISFVVNYYFLCARFAFTENRLLIKFKNRDDSNLILFHIRLCDPFVFFSFKSNTIPWRIIESVGTFVTIQKKTNQDSL